MNEKIIYFKDFSENDWNKAILKLTGNTHAYSWNFINYYMSCYTDVENLSFIYFFENKPISAVIIGLKRSNKKNIFCLGDNNMYCPSPLFLDSKNSLVRKKNYLKIFDIIKSLAKKQNVKKYLIYSHPINNVFDDNKNVFLPKLDSKNQFEHLPFAKNFSIYDSIILDLSISKEKLWENLSYDRKKNITKCSKKDIAIVTCNHKSKIDKIDNYFTQFKKEHFLAAGFQTRTDESWTQMKKNLMSDEADLFLMNYKNKIISFLFCRNYNWCSSSWSQVNLKKYEKEFSPRHLLEWEAIKYYKNKKNKFYDAGPRYFNYKNHEHEKKLITISDFKEKFGGQVYPSVKFEIEF